MKYFLDTEFIESGPWQPIHLISIGIVADDGREFYAVSSDCPLADANDWVKVNVFPNLEPAHYPYAGPATLADIAAAVKVFCSHESTALAPFGRPEFWGYYADYDWVVFAQLFGRMIDLPAGWPMYCRDIKQWCDQLGDPRLPKQNSTEHNALNDARWNRRAFIHLQKLNLNRAFGHSPTAL